MVTWRGLHVKGITRNSGTECSFFRGASLDESGQNKQAVSQCGTYGALRAHFGRTSGEFTSLHERRSEPARAARGACTSGARSLHERRWELARAARGGWASGGRSLAGGGDRGGNFRQSGGAALPGPHGRLHLRPLPAPGESRCGGRSAHSGDFRRLCRVLLRVRPIGRPSARSAGGPPRPVPPPFEGGLGGVCEPGTPASVPV